MNARAMMSILQNAAARNGAAHVGNPDEKRIVRLLERAGVVSVRRENATNWFVTLLGEVK